MNGGGGLEDWESRIMETAKGNVQHRLNRATDEWSICAVSEKQLNFNKQGTPKKRKRIKK